MIANMFLFLGMWTFISAPVPRMTLAVRMDPVFLFKSVATE